MPRIELQESFKRASRELQESFVRASRELQGSFKRASRELLESKREPGRVTFGAKALVVLVLKMCSFGTIFIQIFLYMQNRQTQIADY